MVNNMKIWINKCVEENRSNDFNDSLVFNIDIPRKGGVLTSDIRKGWYNELGVQSVSSICEDLYIIALSVYAADKRVLRSVMRDGWTRNLDLSIPVIEFDKWISVCKDIEKMLSYLSGDIWNISFRRGSIESRYKDDHKRPSQKDINLQSFDAVSLFSGGMDSYCRAYEMISHNKKIVLVGNKEYGGLDVIQKELLKHITTTLKDNGSMFFSFSARAYKPLYSDFAKTENTSRSRSFLFLSAAICIADLIGANTPVYIPENGFIGLNLPLTASRKGSCSTRTTHPYFLKSFNSILSKLGISHCVSNPYAFLTKREMVQNLKDFDGFLNKIHLTISCSHPKNGRWKGDSAPSNCGYCYPCLIRQSSLLDLTLPQDKYKTPDAISYNHYLNGTNNTRSDLVDLISSVALAKKSTDQEILNRIRGTGHLNDEESLKFLSLYKKSIDDLYKMFSKDPKLKAIME